MCTRVVVQLHKMTHLGSFRVINISWCARCAQYNNTVVSLHSCILACKANGADPGITLCLPGSNTKRTHISISVQFLHSCGILKTPDLASVFWIELYSRTCVRLLFVNWTPNCALVGALWTEIWAKYPPFLESKVRWFQNGNAHSYKFIRAQESPTPTIWLDWLYILGTGSFM